MSTEYSTKDSKTWIDFRSAMNLVDAAIYRAKQEGDSRVENVRRISKDSWQHR